MTRVAELLVEWEERWEAGEPVSVHELCGAEPSLAAELEQRIEQLQRFHSLEAPPELPLPAKIGNYAIKQILGAGATGIVYLAKDRSLKRKVAIKVLSPKTPLLSAGDRHRLAENFKQEARVVAKLRHPGIVEIFEAELDQGDPYYVMEQLAGGSLQDRLRAAPQHFVGAPVALAAFMAQVARAVAHAHELGVAHRDLKPGNILLDAAGQPKVSDFGLAKLINDTLWHEDSSALVGGAAAFEDERSAAQFDWQPGTPAYMAPEQFDCDLGMLGLPADIWALGVILYELLAGKRPFAGEQRDQLRRQVCLEPLTPPSAHGVRVDRTLERLTLRCLNRDPQARPKAADLVARLERYLRPSLVRRLATGFQSLVRRRVD